MPAQTIFFCVPQDAYMLVASCRAMRSRPVKGQLAIGILPQPLACQRCELHPRVDALDLPTVPMEAFLRGVKPESAADLGGRA